MFELSKTAEERIKLHNQFGIKDESLKYIYEVVKLMYTVVEKDRNGNVVIDPVTKGPKTITKQRRSGKPSYAHPYEVAYYLYRRNYPIEYVITGFFHDVLEDTQYTLADISLVLDEYIKRYPEKVKDKEAFKDNILTAVDALTKKKHFSRPKEPTNPPLMTKDGQRVTLTDMKRGYYWRKGSIEENKVTRVYVTGKDLEHPEIWEEKKRELEEYNKLMIEYLNTVKESEIAHSVKAVDRMVNLTDFSKDVDSFWIEKYTRETGEFFVLTDFLDGLSDTLQDDFFFFFSIARFTRTVRKEAEINGNGNILAPVIYKNDVRDVLVENLFAGVFDDTPQKRIDKAVMEPGYPPAVIQDDYYKKGEKGTQLDEK